MEQKNTPKRDPALVLACALVIIFGLLNIFSGLLPLIAGGSSRFLENWGFILLSVLGFLMVFAGICGIANKLKKAWNGFGYAMLIISVALLLAMIFLRGISMTYVLNVVAAILYQTKVK